MGAFVLVDELVEDEPDDFRALLIDMEFTVPDIIAQHIPAEHHALLHTPALPPLDPVGGLAAFLLRDGGHDGEPQLGVRIQRVDVVVHEDDADAEFLELAGVEDAVQRVAGETADLLRDDQVEGAPLGIGHHPVEGVALLGAGAGDALVNIDFGQLPEGVALYVFAEVFLLALKRIDLIFLVRRYPAVGRDPPRLVRGWNQTHLPFLIGPASPSF